MITRSLLALLALLLAVVGLAQPRAYAQPSRPPHDPQAALRRIERERGPVAVRTDAESGSPAFLHGRLGRLEHGDSEPAKSSVALALDFFRRYGDAWGIDQPEQSLRLITETQDQRGYINLRFKQTADGLPVLDTDLRAQIDPDGTLSTINGRLLPGVQPPATQPRLSGTAAMERAQMLVGGTMQGEPRLGVARIDGSDHLVWELWRFDPQQPARWLIRIDALDGTVLQQQNVLHFALNRRTYDAQQKYSLPGVLVRSEGQGPVADADVNAAHDNAGIVYNYYRTMFGRDSLDNKGMPIISSVHYSYNNAYWNGTQMIYGDGDGVLFGPLPQALDVVAHEMTHGVTENSAKLGYSGQPGALNESFSDIFGMLIEQQAHDEPNDWDIAEDVWTPGVSGDALRSAADPTRYGNPSVWGEFLRTARDDGGVHFNSGILNHVAYEIGTSIGRDKTARIFYRTLTDKLTETSDFLVTRDLAIQSCAELISTAGINQQDCADVQMAFVRSGIGISSSVPPVQPLPNRVLLPIVVQNGTMAPRLAPPALPACNTELARNAGFESGQSSWVTDANGPTVGVGNPTRSGTRSARLAQGFQMLQWMLLPSGAQSAQINFYVYRAPSNASPGTVTLNVRAETSDGTSIATVASITGATSTSAYLPYSATVNVQNLRDLRLVFQDRSGTHYIDDVSIVARCGS